jgi:flavin-dependent dehydrogenase
LKSVYPVQNNHREAQMNPAKDPESGPVRVAVIGGGPAGTFFAIQYLRLTIERGIKAEVTIFEPKQFEQSGASNCNCCQGVISSALVDQLCRLGLKIPERVIQQRISRYRLITGAGSVCLDAPDGAHIFTVYRGHGPNPDESGPLSFDQFLLDTALKLGARKVSERIARIRFEQRAGPSPAVLTDYEGRSYSADMIIGAFGVNSTTGHEFEQLGFGYRRPSTHAAVMAEFPLVHAADQEGAGNEITVFIPGSRLVQFAVLTPKKDYVTVSLIGKGLNSKDIDQFIPELTGNSSGTDLAVAQSPRCRCAPRFPVRHSPRLAMAHCMIVGDAGISRYYKKGIDSALRSASLAARVLAEYGPADVKNLQRCYERPIQREFRFDNLLGQMMFRMYLMINRYPSLTLAHLRLARGECALAGIAMHRLRWVLWNMFTGDAPYRIILLHCLDPRLAFGVICSILRTLAGGKKMLKRESCNAGR